VSRSKKRAAARVLWRFDSLGFGFGFWVLGGLLLVGWWAGGL